MPSIEVLQALEAAGADPAWLAHHARRAGDVAAIRRLAPAAARMAGAAGGHRQALAQWEAALATYDARGDLASTPGRAEALEGVAVEAYLCGRPQPALEARQALLALHEAEGDLRRAGDDLRWLSRIHWWSGQGKEAETLGDRSIAVLEQFPDSRELALALSGRSQLAMLSERRTEAIALGERAVALGRRIGDRETVAHALTNVGTALIATEEHERGRAMLEEAFAVAAEDGHDDHAARALVNLRLPPSSAAAVTAGWRVTSAGRSSSRAGGTSTATCSTWSACARCSGWGWASGWPVRRTPAAPWRSASSRASASAPRSSPSGACRPAAASRTRARRSPTPDRAVATHELQRLGPVAAARAEHAWLEGDLAGCGAAARDANDLALRRGDAWTRGELAFWLGAPAASTSRPRPSPSRTRAPSPATGGARATPGRRRLPLRGGRRRE